MRSLLAFLIITTPALAAPICRPDAGEVMSMFGAEFIDIIETPDDPWDQLMVIEADEQLHAVRLKEGCARWPVVALGKAPLRL